ncbi:pectinesterase family protein [Galbibacter sp.]|jgi:pectinesterase|uniref:pectinesterase family protein n=1 Tax=Galbibacter sp. TaxID=2918471 RepID=UPI003A901E66
MNHTLKSLYKLLLVCTLFLYAKEQMYGFHPNDGDMVVATDGSGDYRSIQEAINNAKSFPYQRITIWIKNGIYKEKIRVYEWNTNLSLIGEDPDSTIILYDDYFGKINKGRNSTFHTPTFSVEATGTILKNLKIMNTAGSVGQAVALAITADKVMVENCSIIGNQDTVYLSGAYSKVYFKACKIEGSTDFIFGQATAVFDHCTIHSTSDSYITAASTPENVPFGFVFIECKLTAAPNVKSVYLGRPWRYNAKTAFIRCDMGGHINPKGWHDWNKPESHQRSFYAEYKSSGPGSNTEQRVEWSHQLTKKQQASYTLEKLLKSKNDNNWYLD